MRRFDFWGEMLFFSVNLFVMTYYLSVMPQLLHAKGAIPFGHNPNDWEDYQFQRLSGIFNGLGVETTLIYRGPEILRGFDMDMRTNLREAMEKKGIRVVCRDTILDVSQAADGRLQLVARAPHEHLAIGGEIAARHRVVARQPAPLGDRSVEAADVPQLERAVGRARREPHAVAVPAHARDVVARGVDWSWVQIP